MKKKARFLGFDILTFTKIRSLFKQLLGYCCFSMTFQALGKTPVNFPGFFKISRTCMNPVYNTKIRPVFCGWIHPRHHFPDLCCTCKWLYERICSHHWTQVEVYLEVYVSIVLLQVNNSQRTTDISEAHIYCDLYCEYHEVCHCCPYSRSVLANVFFLHDHPEPGL